MSKCLSCKSNPLQILFPMQDSKKTPILCCFQATFTLCKCARMHNLRVEYRMAINIKRSLLSGVTFPKKNSDTNRGFLLSGNNKKNTFSCYIISRKLNVKAISFQAFMNMTKLIPFLRTAFSYIYFFLKVNY